MGTWSMLKERIGSRRASLGVAGTLAAGVALLLTSVGSAAPAAAPERILGWRTSLGNGEAASFAELRADGAPAAVGIAFTPQALQGLPTAHSDGHHCSDQNGDGSVGRPDECFATHEFAIPLPDAVSRRDDVPFKWVLLNWNLHGHAPPGVYDVPHFDVHFYMTPIADALAIHAGPCGPEFVDCDAFAKGKQPLPTGLMHPDFADLDAVAPAMGNHLIDLSGPEFNGERFTRSWLFGIYGGQVTFYEEMVTLAYLLSKPDACSAIKTPPGVAVAGYYPTQRCVRYEAGTNTYVVSMEGFAYRESTQATAAQPAAAAHHH